MNRLLAAAALLGFSAVALGAFGAHALNNRLSLEASDWWETATLYALVHAALGVAAGLNSQARLIRSGGWCAVSGGAVFAGTLYAMALGAPRWLGAVAPIGGVLMLLGWGLVALGALAKRTN